MSVVIIPIIWGSFGSNPSKKASQAYSSFRSKQEQLLSRYHILQSKQHQLLSQLAGGTDSLEAGLERNANRELIALPPIALTRPPHRLPFFIAFFQALTLGPLSRRGLSSQSARPFLSSGEACVLNRRSLTTDKQDAENRLFKSLKKVIKSAPGSVARASKSLLQWTRWLAPAFTRLRKLLLELAGTFHIEKWQARTGKVN
ncbi:hypothetical protein QYF36_024177 [Acer negundo]|nr:hypothetical protein QYF36_024177 [Acer negundo]